MQLDNLSPETKTLVINANFQRYIDLGIQLVYGGNLYGEQYIVFAYLYALFYKEHFEKKLISKAKEQIVYIFNNFPPCSN